MAATACSSGIVKMVILVILVCSVSEGTNSDDYHDSKCLKVPVLEFVGTVGAAMAVVRQVMTTVSRFSGGGSFRLENAVSDCLDLMDFTVDQLSSANIAASQHPNGSRAEVIANIKTWLSGAMINQDTCKEGLDGTDGVLKKLISASLDQASSLVHDLLSGVANSNPGGRKLTAAGDQFPYWLKPHDRKLLQAGGGVEADAVVVADGTGNFTSIKEAVSAAPDNSSRRYVIYVKRGTYREYVDIGKKKWNIMLIGDGAGATIISGNRNFIDGWTTYRSATFAVKGRGFIARDITFENTAGPAKHQAVAFRSDSDLSVLYRCAIQGFQDTLYAHSQRQFYRECQITGTIDFIFGDGSVVFQDCDIRARQGLPGQKNTVTAQGRKDPIETTGFSLQFCNFSVEPAPALNSTAPTYLGRPWKLYSRTVVMQSYISGSIRPEGWLEWNGAFALDTLYYAEYMNYGPGAGLGARVKWPGYHMLNDSVQASGFTVAQFIMGNTWLPSTGVRYTAGLAM